MKVYTFYRISISNSPDSILFEEKKKNCLFVTGNEKGS